MFYVARKRVNLWAWSLSIFLCFPPCWLTLTMQTSASICFPVLTVFKLAGNFDSRWW